MFFETWLIKANGLLNYTVGLWYKRWYPIIGLSGHGESPCDVTFHHCIRWTFGPWTLWILISHAGVWPGLHPAGGSRSVTWASSSRGQQECGLGFIQQGAAGVWPGLHPAGGSRSVTWASSSRGQQECVYPALYCHPARRKLGISLN